MKHLILSILIFLPILACAGDLSFDLSSEIHNTKEIKFKPHHGGGPYGSYLSMTLPFEPMEELLGNVIDHRGFLKTRGEAHITVISPVEFFYKLKPAGMTIEMIDEIALKHNIQSSIFNIFCLGRGEAVLNDKLEYILETVKFSSAYC